MSVRTRGGHREAKARPATILETERLVFRRLVPGDLDDLYGLYRDPEMRRHYPGGTLSYEQTKEELEWFLDGHPAHRELGLWATLEKESGAFIGRCGLLPWTIEDRFEVEIAYMIAKSHWGRGLGAEAARALVRNGFERLDLPRLIALMDPANVASARTATAAGLRFEREIEMDGERTAVYAIARPAVAMARGLRP